MARSPGDVYFAQQMPWSIPSSPRFSNTWSVQSTWNWVNVKLGQREAGSTWSWVNMKLGQHDTGSTWNWVNVKLGQRKTGSTWNWVKAPPRK